MAQAQPTTLEPVMKVEIQAPDDNMGPPRANRLSEARAPARVFGMPESVGVAAVTDAELARRIAAAVGRGAVAGAEEAELCRRFERRLVLFGRRRLGSDDAARDLAQEALLLSLRKLRAGEVREPERVGAFILGVARTVASRWRSREARSLPLAVPDGEPAAGVTVPEPVDPLARSRVAQCVEALPEPQRAVVLLSFYAERTSAEVASALGLTSGNVRVIRHRGVARLRDCLGLGGEEAVA